MHSQAKIRIFFCDRQDGQKLSQNFFPLEFSPSQFGHDDVLLPICLVKNSVKIFSDRFFWSQFRLENFSIDC